MKSLPALLLFLGAAILLSACGPPKEADYKKLGYSDGIYTDPDTGKEFTGIARLKEPDGKIRGEYPFKNGRMHGMVKEWHANGKPSTETEFENGERSGRNIEWTEDGALFRERRYEHDRIITEKNHGAGK